MERGTEAVVGEPIFKEMAAMFLIPAKICNFRSSSVMSKMFGSKMEPESDFDHNQSISEGRNLQHVQEGGFGHADFVSRLDQVHIMNDFDRALGNLGWDIQGLEERRLLRTQTCVLSRHLDIQRGNGSSPPC